LAHINALTAIQAFINLKIKMKHTLIFLFFVAFSTNVIAQESQENQSFTYAELKGGYGVSIFGKGLKERYDAGNFSTSGGGLFSLAAYHKFKKINYLNFGIKYKSLGAGPATGDSLQEMFFNYWGAAVGIKYFPFDKQAKKGIYVQADYFFVTQFTQKYRNTKNLNFDHQFAIGNGVAFGLGYDIPLGKKRSMITIGLEYEMDKRRGEVTGIGDKTFISSNFGIMAGIKF
jgi:hypothetical protein